MTESKCKYVAKWVKASCHLPYNCSSSPIRYMLASNTEAFRLSASRRLRTCDLPTLCSTISQSMWSSGNPCLWWKLLHQLFETMTSSFYRIFLSVSFEIPKVDRIFISEIPKVDRIFISSFQESTWLSTCLFVAWV
jgi:hypothetical protein